MIKRTAKIAIDRVKKKKNPFKFRSGSSKPKQRHLAKRHARERRFRFYGYMAIAVSLLFLAMLFGSIFTNGYSAFTQTQLRIPVVFDNELVESQDYRKILQNSLK